MRGNDSLKQVAVALAVGLITTVGAARAADPGSKPSPEFARFDANGDGYVSRAEAAKLIVNG